MQEWHATADGGFSLDYCDNEFEPADDIDDIDDRSIGPVDDIDQIDARHIDGIVEIDGQSDGFDHDDDVSEIDDSCPVDDAIPVSSSSQNPHHRFERLTHEFASKLRANPLIPVGVHRDSGDRTAASFCALCGVQGPSESYVINNPAKHARTWLGEHLNDFHRKDFVELHDAASRCGIYADVKSGSDWPKYEAELHRRLLALYTAVLRCHQQMHVPDVGYTVNRRCLEEFYSQYRDEHIESLVCFCCAQVYTRDTYDVASRIRMYSALAPDPCGKSDISFLGSSKGARALDVLSRDTYDERFTQIGFESTEDKRVALDPWTLGVPRPDCGQQVADDESDDSSSTEDEQAASSCRSTMPTADKSASRITRTRVLCCPVDRQCTTCSPSADLCRNCRIPLCDDCHDDLNEGKLPADALANDNWQDFMLSYIFEHDVTYAELVAASIVHPSMSTVEINVYEKWHQYSGNDALPKLVHKHNGVMGAIGAITAFILEFEDVCAQIEPFSSKLQHEDKECSERELPDLPASPEVVARVLQFRLYQSKDLTDSSKREVQRVFLKQAFVRAEVVAHLIELNVKRQMPGYAEYKGRYGETFLERARRLYPNSDVAHPAIYQVCKQFHSDPTDVDIEEGKAAVPATPSSDVGIDPTRHAQTLGISFGSTSLAGANNNTRIIRGLQNLEDAAQSKIRHNRMVGINANQTKLVETFTPIFFVLAFAFLYSRGGGWVDYYRSRSTRRKPPDNHGLKQKHELPTVDLARHCRRMCRIILKQFVRDRSHLFCLRDLWFRSQVNLARTFTAITSEVSQSLGKYTECELASDVVEAVQNILQRLSMSYIASSGAKIPVNGDVSKVHLTQPPLNALQRKILQSYELTARRLPGTQEVRHMMLKYGEGYLVRYGATMMLTLSPDPYHSMLVCHLHRGLEADPIYLRDVDLKPYISKDRPSLATYYNDNGEMDSYGIFVPLKEPLLDLPTFEQRQRIVSQDPQASVEAFRTIVKLVLRTLLGVRCCSDCPSRSGTCNCQDEFGSVAHPEGGVFGMIEAYCASIEAQNMGALHAHILIFLNWVFQHTPMIEIARQLATNAGAFCHGMDDLHHWKNRCCSEQMSDAFKHKFDEIKLDNIETEWTTKHRNDGGKILHAHSDRVSRMDAAQFRLWHDRAADTTLACSNIHWHPKGSDGVRRPPKSCLSNSAKEKERRLRAQRLGKPLDERISCKYGMPKPAMDSAAILCDRLARQQGHTTHGERTGIGRHEGPRSETPVGEHHGALAVACSFNTHVRIAYRVPPVGCAHSELCPIDSACRKKWKLTKISYVNKFCREVARIQKLHVRYVNSYHAKSHTIAKSRLKSFVSIHTKRLEEFKVLGKRSRTKGITKPSITGFAQKAVQRMLTDTVTKGRTAYAAEILNLIAYSDDSDVTRAESFQSAPPICFRCRLYIKEFDRKRVPIIPQHNDTSATSKIRMTFHGVAADAKLAADLSNFEGVLYGYRPCIPQLWEVPAYQFVLNWYFRRATYPKSLKQNSHQTHCSLTEDGKNYLLEGKPTKDMVAGEHYQISGTSGLTHGQMWFALHPSAPDEWRNSVVIVRQCKPFPEKIIQLTSIHHQLNTRVSCYEQTSVLSPVYLD